MSSLKLQHKTRQHLSALCGEAVQQQIGRGDATPTQLRQRRRHLLKALRKRLPQSVKHSPDKLLHSAVMVLALWGFGGLVIPGTAQASAVFEHASLEGFDMDLNVAPSLVDIDNDGDLDAFVGRGNGTVMYYRNSGGASSANFVAADGVTISNPLDGVVVGFSATPTFADIDGDGDQDAFVGARDGTVKFYLNDGDASTPNFFAANGTTVINPLVGVVVGAASTPTFADIDGDGDLDAFVGAGDGTVKFYRNNGNATVATFAADVGGNPLSGINLAYATTPSFIDIDNDGDLDLFVGESITVKFYRNTGSATVPTFTADVAGNPLAIITLMPSAVPTFADIDNDGDMDAFVGSNHDSVSFYENAGSANSPTFLAGLVSNPLDGYNASASAPSFTDIDNDGDLDVFVGHMDGTVALYRNTGTLAVPSFTVDSADNPLASIAMGSGSYIVPTFADIDNDGDLDAFIGERLGTVKFYRNNNGTFVADASNNPLIMVSAIGYIAPAFCDIDNDGDLDAFIGDYDGTVNFYRNDNGAFVADVAGNPLSLVAAGSATLEGISAAPSFVDTDNDGDMDVFVGANDGTIKFYQNNGTTSVPNFVAANGTTVINPLVGVDLVMLATPTFADIDNDGDMDAFIGAVDGRVHFFENLDPTSNASSGGSGGGGGGGSPGIPLLASLAALLFGRRKSFPQPQ